MATNLISRRAVVAAALTPWLARSSGAQTASSTAGPFPNRPLRFIVPFPAGSIADVQTRPIAQKLSDEWRQQVLVDNRPGATATLGLELAARSAPDGYTIAMAPIAPLTILPHLMKLPFDPLHDFMPITKTTSGPMLLVTQPNAPFDTVVQLIEQSRAKAGHFKVGGFGVGSIGHLATVMISKTTGADLTHVPYQGGPQQIVDLIGGQIPLLLDFATTLRPFLEAGKVKTLAVTNDKRLANLPAVPTFEELGYKGLHITAWSGVVAPAATPPEIVASLHSALVKVLNMPDLRATLMSGGAEIGADSSEAFAAFIRAEHARWGKVIKDHAITLG